MEKYAWINRLYDTLRPGMASLKMIIGLNSEYRVRIK
jgi:hypothetical protein